jgi:hypothetical protein
MYRTGASVSKRSGIAEVEENPAAMIATVPRVGISAAYPGKRVLSLNWTVAQTIAPRPTAHRAEAARRGSFSQEVGTRASSPPRASSQPRVRVEK